MTITIYGIKACDTCRKALKEIEGSVLHDVRDAPLSEAQLKVFHDLFGEKLLNTRSTTWRGLSEEERQIAPIELLLAHPTLMKRPIIASQDQTTIGWDTAAKEVWL